ncbi:nucleotidyltransferase family protein [Aerococcaceae bacterium NML190073]|nr:nucleotidyltransferase family protein [Aerococcaceae bacterium NML190073]
MKRVVGVITEYNPFHHGHAYQLRRLRELTQADVVVVLMSGNVVQRGEFTLVDKWTRAEVAVAQGADLVIEMPIFATVQSADFFAQKCVDILARIGCRTLVFGTETANARQLRDYVMWLNAHDDVLQTAVRQQMKRGRSYPVAYAQAVTDLGEAPFDISTPNHLLAVQYTRANMALTQPMELLAIPRIETLSGSQIRAKHQAQTLAPTDLPSEMFNGLKATACWQDYWPLLRYQLTSQTRDSLRQIVGVDEGLDKHLLAHLDAPDFEHFIKALISKRWTRSRIQRALLMIVLNIRRSEWQQAQRSELALRVLAYDEVGQQFLRHYTKQVDSLQLFSNLKQHHLSYALNLKADRIYQLNQTNPIPEQIRGKYPAFIQKYIDKMSRSN